ncbi:MAG TPA: sulfatase-like hydrolase/transferase, partial [Polyangiaceae bacterium]|nr:sulfatase-like hydrolase/transferase [Polyangiaceae bacterium]
MVLSLALGLILALLDFVFARRLGLGFSPSDLGQLIRAHGLVALLVGALLLAAGRLDRLVARWLPLARRHPLWSAAFGGALLSVGGAVWLARGLSSGGWIAAQRWVGWFRLAAVLVLSGGGGLLAWCSRFRERRWLRVALGLLTLVLQVADRLVLIGLYPQLHIALYAISLTLGWLALQGLPRPAWLKLPRWLPPSLAAGVVLAYLSLAVVPLRAASLRLSRSLRIAAAPFVPRADHGLALRLIRAQREVPLVPPNRGKRLSAEPPRNVLFLVVDTLRADAVPPLRQAGGHWSKEDTPFLDRWLESAYRFDTVYAEANATRVSIPATFESRHGFEIGHADTVTLGQRARAAGLATAAVVPKWFVGIDGSQTNALDGFDQVQVYGSPSWEKVSKETRKLLEANRDRPFFVWAHFMGLHAPYETKKPHPAGSSAYQQYGGALRELDKRLREIEGALRKHHLDRNTLVVMMSDHGEMLGENGVHHHAISLYEPEMRVPLAFWVPGGRPKTISSLVGNLDIVPTVFDLLHQPIDDLRGRSLVPLLGGAEPPRDPAYFIMTRRGDAAGLVTNDRKLIFDTETHAFSVFERADGLHTRDLFGQDPAGDAELLDTFVEMNPTFVSSELADAPTRASLAERLGQLELRDDSRALQILLRLGAQVTDPQVREAIWKAFRRTKSQAVKRRIFREVGTTEPSRWAEAGWSELKSSRGFDEIGWLEVFELTKVAVLDEAWAAQRLTELADCRGHSSRAWSGYLSSSSSLGPALLPVLTAELRCALDTEGAKRR